jgi:dienelactone hydrolase
MSVSRAHFLGTSAALLGSLAAAPAAAAFSPSLFAYDAKASGLTRGAALDIGGIRTIEATYASTTGSRSIAATYIGPARETQPTAGVLFVHGLSEDSEQVTRTEFRADALELARVGVGSLAIDTMWSSPNWVTNRSPANDFENSITQVKDLRRACDVLQTFLGPAPRWAFVGRDFGAMLGALFAGADDRVRNAVFIAAPFSLADAYLFGKKPDDVGAYRTRMTALEVGAALRSSHLDNALLQFATNDKYVPNDRIDQWAAALPPSTHTTVKRYDTDHAMQLPDAGADRRAWLRTTLGKA